MLRGTHAGKNSSALSEIARREYYRQPARRKHSRVAASLQHGAGHRPAYFGGHLMTTEHAWPRIAVVGAGAVGGYFGGMLARAGAPVTMIGRAQHVEAIQRDGLFIDSIHFKEHVSVSASTEL